MLARSAPARPATAACARHAGQRRGWRGRARRLQNTHPSQDIHALARKCGLPARRPPRPHPNALRLVLRGPRWGGLAPGCAAHTPDDVAELAKVDDRGGAIGAGRWLRSSAGHQPRGLQGKRWGSGHVKEAQQRYNVAGTLRCVLRCCGWWCVVCARCRGPCLASGAAAAGAPPSHSPPGRPAGLHDACLVCSSSATNKGWIAMRASGRGGGRHSDQRGHPARRANKEGKWSGCAQQPAAAATTAAAAAGAAGLRRAHAGSATICHARLQLCSAELTLVARQSPAATQHRWGAARAHAKPAGGAPAGRVLAHSGSMQMQMQMHQSTVVFSQGCCVAA